MQQPTQKRSVYKIHNIDLRSSPRVRDGGLEWSWLTPTARVPCSNAANIAKTHDLDVKWILHLAKFHSGAKALESVYSVPAQETAKHRTKFSWPPLSNVGANEANMRNPLKFAGVPQTQQPILAASGPCSTYCEDMWRRYWCLKSFFFRLSIHVLVMKI